MRTSSSCDAGWAILRTSAAWSALTKSPRGHIVVTASTASFGRAPGKAANTTASMELPVLSVAASERAEHDLTVNTVAPGWMDTGMLSSQLEILAATMSVSSDEVIACFRAAQPAGCS
nr:MULTISPECIES: SDR family NAD(P)-dependent oxidoreductase [unclassified Bradyrhizobium]